MIIILIIIVKKEEEITTQVEINQTEPRIVPHINQRDHPEVLLLLEVENLLVPVTEQGTLPDQNPVQE